MRWLSSTAFDPRAERDYYAASRPGVHDFRYLDAYYRHFLGGYARYFDGIRILDMGAGECLHGQMVCTASTPKLYVNFDLISERLAPAASRNSLPAIRFVVGDGFALPFQDGAFDIVWGSGILVRLRPLERAMREISRVLRPQGLYLGIEPNFANPGVLLRFVLMRRGDRNDGWLRHGTLRAAFAEAGLRPELRFFWVRVPWLRHPFFSPTLGVIGHKGDNSP